MPHHFIFCKIRIERVNMIAIIASFIALIAMIAGCGDDTVQPSPPDDDLVSVGVGIVVSDFPRAPDTPSLFSGTDEKVVDLRSSQKDTIYTAIRLIPNQPQFIVLINSEYQVYGSVLFTGNESEVILSSASTTEVPIVIAQHLWSDNSDLVQTSLAQIRNHAEYSTMVDLVREGLQSALMEEALSDSIITAIGARIVLETTSPITNSSIITLFPATVGTVTLTIPQEAVDAGIFLEGPFNVPNANLASVGISIFNTLPRYLISCRLDYVQGMTEPLPGYKYPPDLLEPGYLLSPSVENCVINFDLNNLDRVDIVLVGPGGRGDPQIPCGDDLEDWRLAHRNLLLRSVKYFGGMVLSLNPSYTLYDRLIKSLMSLDLALVSIDYQMIDAVNSHSYKEVGRVEKEFYQAFIKFVGTIPDVKILKAAIIITQLKQGFSWAADLAKISNAPVKVVFTMTAIRQICPPGDCEWTPGSWELQWSDRGTSYFSYEAKVAQLLPEDQMGFLFTPDPIGSGTPQAIVFVYDISQVPLNVPVECQMHIDFGIGSSGELHSPIDYKNDDGVPPAQTYVTFLQLDLPEGLFPGLASGYFSGNLQVLHTPDPMDMETWWAENVVIIDAPFDSVRVYAESGYNSRARQILLR